MFPRLSARRDVTGDKETRTFHSFAVPLTAIAVVEASVIMVYCAAFYCNANSSKNKVTVGLISSLRSELCFKKANVNASMGHDNYNNHLLA